MLQRHVIKLLHIGYVVIILHNLCILDGHKEERAAVLLFSTLGISRSATVVLAYLMHCYKWSLKVSVYLLINSENKCSNLGLSLVEVR